MHDIHVRKWKISPKLQNIAHPRSRAQAEFKVGKNPENFHNVPVERQTSELDPYEFRFMRKGMFPM